MHNLFVLFNRVGSELLFFMVLTLSFLSLDTSFTTNDDANKTSVEEDSQDSSQCARVF